MRGNGSHQLSHKHSQYIQRRQGMNVTFLIAALRKYDVRTVLNGEMRSQVLSGDCLFALVNS